MVANYFISHTKLQSYIATLMIETLPEFKEGYNVLVCPPGRLHARNESWDRIDTPDLDLFRKPNYLGVGEHVRLVRAYVEEMSAYEHARLMVSNFWSPLNRVSYALALKYPAIDVCIYPEGLANLLVPEVRGLAGAREWVKAITLRMQGIPYKYTRHISGELAADIVYTFNPELMENVGIPLEKLKRVRLKDHSKAGRLDMSKCLLVGQGCDPVFSEKEIKRSAELADMLVRRYGCKKIFYKTHPISRTVDNCLKASADVVLLDDERLVEEIVPELECGLVISNYSSALFNLKLMYGDGVKCVSIMGDVPLSRHYMYGEIKAERYRMLCQKYGIEIVS